MEELRDKDFDCPSLLRDEELEDLETKNSRGITRKRRRDGEGEVFNQREDEEAGGETGSENKDEEDKETQAGSKHEVTAMEITQVYSIQRSILYSTTGGDHSVSFSQVPGSETVDSCPPPPAKKKRKRIPFSADQLVYLEALFLEDQYPDLQKKRLIAAALGVTPEKMRIWFQNRRTKLRKEQSSITAEVEHRQSRAGYNSSPTHQPVNSTIPTQAPNSKGAPSFSGNFATKVPQLTSTAPSFPTLSNQTVPSHSNLQASLSSPGQSRMRDGGQHQLSSQGELAEYHPHPMHSPPPLHQASPPVFTKTYNPANLIPPLVHTLAHTPPLFLDAVEAGSSLAHRDSQSLQTGTRSFFDFGEKLGDLTSSQQNNNLPYKLQPSYPSSQPQHQPQASLPYMAYLPPPPYPTHTPPDSNPTPYLTFGPGGNSTGMVTNLTRGHAYFQSQSRGQVLLQSAGHHGGMAEITPTRASSLLPSQVSPAAPECPPAPPCVKIEREIHSQVHFDFSPHRFFT
ncbi:diencephalon/mesencephalon homeobox protein 1-B-like isoform X1 [Acanthopagrus latus]|uniref:diencephalon/mesencephalon homeobox protein 1-B-like isoform X1 n=1 Tax=Acanthopagrus latus TaxID=8177 RepID=UPI00187CFD4C|nr:diencephalon/mesencephalon homeobox protein 1-B-like isoform X1 [Acanthopagrus latus]